MKKILFALIMLFVLLIIQKDSEKMEMDMAIKKLTRQAARWSVAAQQDENPMIAVLHANYGAGFLWALKDIASNDQIKMSTGIDVQTFEKNIIDIQDKATKKMASICPKYAPPSSYLTKISGEGPSD